MGEFPAGPHHRSVHLFSLQNNIESIVIEILNFTSVKTEYIGFPIADIE